MQLNSSDVSTTHRVLDVAPTTAKQTARDLLIIFLLSIPLFFWKLGGFGFFDPDEGRYAEIPREMMVNHDWITPTLNFVKYFEKPPLLYWLTASSFKLFGLNETAARLVPALCALLGLAMTYFLGRRMFGRRVGILSACVLATTLFWPLMARQIVIDMLLSVALFAAVAFWWLGHTEENARLRVLDFAAFWVFLGSAVLSKGPVAVLLVGATIGIYVIVCRQSKTTSLKNWALGIALFLLISAPWFIAVAARNSEFNRYFWWGQNVARFLGIGKNREHVEPIYFFLMFLPLLFFPWAFLLPAMAITAWKRVWPQRAQPFSPQQRAAIYLFINAAFITLFFSASTSKLLTYILPVFPALAILVGAYLDSLWRSKIEYWKPSLSVCLSVFALVCGALGIAAFGVALRLIPSLTRWLDKTLAKSLTIPFSPMVYGLALGTIFLLWCGATVLSLKRRDAKILATSFIGCSTALLLTVFAVLNTLSPDLNMKALATYIQPGLDSGARLVSYESYAQGLGFYTQRRIVLINGLGEIEFGADQLPPDERQIWFKTARGGDDDTRDLSPLKGELQSAQPVYVLVKNHKTAQNLLPRLPKGTVEIVWNSRRSILGNSAAAKITPPRPLLKRD